MTRRAIRADIAHTPAQQRIMGAYLALPHETIPLDRSQKRSRGGPDSESLALSATVRRLLPHAAEPETKIKHFALGKVPCQHCGIRNRRVDPETRACLDRTACTKRAEEWA